MFYPFFDPTSIPMIFMDPRSNTPHWTHVFPLRSYLSAAASCTRPSQRTRDMKHPTAGGCFSTKRYGIVTTENWNWICNNWNVELLNQKNNLGFLRERNRWQVIFWWMQRTSSAAMFQVSLGCLKRAPNRQRLCNTLHFRVSCWSFKHGQNSKSVGICWKSMKIQKCCRAWYGDVNCPHRPAGLVIYLWAGPLVSLVWPTLVPQSILRVNICGCFCWWANLSWVHIHYSPFMQPAMKSRTLEIEMTGNLLQSRGRLVLGFSGKEPQGCNVPFRAFHSGSFTAVSFTEVSHQFLGSKWSKQDCSDNAFFLLGHHVKLGLRCMWNAPEGRIPWRSKRKLRLTLTA